MSKRTIIFQEHKKITIKEIDELFYFAILYYDKWSSHNIIKQSEYIVVAACRGLMKISLEEVNGKDYLFITDDISDFTDYPKQIDDFLSLQCDNDSKVTAEMLYHAVMRFCGRDSQRNRKNASAEESGPAHFLIRGKPRASFCFAGNRVPCCGGGPGNMDCRVNF